jgi:hypothetical protein
MTAPRDRQAGPIRRRISRIGWRTRGAAVSVPLALMTSVTAREVVLIACAVAYNTRHVVHLRLRYARRRGKSGCGLRRVTRIDGLAATGLTAAALGCIAWPSPMFRSLTAVAAFAVIILSSGT